MSSATTAPGNRALYGSCKVTTTCLIWLFGLYRTGRTLHIRPKLLVRPRQVNASQPTYPGSELEGLSIHHLAGSIVKKYSTNIHTKIFLFKILYDALPNSYTKNKYSQNNNPHDPSTSYMENIPLCPESTAGSSEARFNGSPFCVSRERRRSYVGFWS